MESENTIKEIKLEIPDLTIKDSNNKTSKTYNHDKNVAVVLFILAVFCFIYDVVLASFIGKFSHMSDCLFHVRISTSW